ncbi:hypothetical protein SAMN00777080_2018 [Aquiflexum balticum DSM 16537]|uniref:Uncharacterized protein n=1 Tax=Aquiflexum balticum DSM 16537 TaxID=758820 RepID=A0A1W2H4N6_9BACT|nr:hypothetical protein [Aquiflexum balticum]SMD43426.1 hypothetical protein SAMN00777080_2018 [Aquiflexum balticum DSM 16537]
MNQQENENRNSQHEDKSIQKTNEESGRNDLNPTDRDERDSDREFELDEDKERNLDIISKSKDSDKDRNRSDKDTGRELPSHEDPNVNADKARRNEKFGTMRNQPNKRSVGSDK